MPDITRSAKTCAKDIAEALGLGREYLSENSWEDLVDLVKKQTEKLLAIRKITEDV